MSKKFPSKNIDDDNISGESDDDDEIRPDSAKEHKNNSINYEPSKIPDLTQKTTEANADNVSEVKAVTKEGEMDAANPAVAQLTNTEEGQTDAIPVIEAPPEDPPVLDFFTLKLADLTARAPKVVANRLVKIREWEEDNPNRKYNDEFIQEYLLQEYSLDHEIKLPKGGINTSQEALEFRRAILNNKKLFSKENEIPIQQYQRNKIPTKLLEEIVPKDQPQKLENKYDPLQNLTREEAIKRIMQLQIERGQIGPDPKMMAKNKNLEQAVIQSSLAKKAMLEAASKPLTNKSGPLKPKIKDKTKHSNIKSQTSEKDPFRNLTLQQLQNMIRKEEDLRGSEMNANLEGSSKRSTKKAAILGNPQLFNKVREIRSTEKKGPGFKKKFEEMESDEEPIEFQDFCYGNVRFLDLDKIRALGELKGDDQYDEMIGMIANNKWLKIHFGMEVDPDNPPPPPSNKESMKKIKKNSKDKKTSKESDKKPPEETDKKNEMKLSETYIDMIKKNTGVDYKNKKVVSRIPRDFAFTRPPRQVMYVEIPIVNEIYGANWTRIRKDTRKKVKKRKLLPEFIQDSYTPDKMIDMILNRIELNSFYQKHFVQKANDLDLFDWMMHGFDPNDTNVQQHYQEENDAEKMPKTWFKQAPKYKPISPVDSLFEEFNFCGYGNREKPFFIEFTLPRSLLLFHGSNNFKQKFFNSIKKPEGSFPGYAFPSWTTWNLDQKLPWTRDVPKDSFYWTRGFLGQTLHKRAKREEFRLDDPMNKYQFEYDPLHDEGCNGYFKIGSVRNNLYKRKFIDKEGIVFCTQKQQNQYRNYLRQNIWKPECEAVVKMEVDRRQRTLEARKYFRQNCKNWDEQRTKYNRIVANGKEISKRRKSNLIEKYEIAKENRRQRLEIYEKQKQEKLQKIKDDNKSRNALPRLSLKSKELELITENQNKKCIYEMKQEIAQNNRTTLAIEKYLIADEKRKITWEKKVKSMESKNKMLDWMTKATKVDKKHRVEKHEQKVLEERLRYPKMLAARKAKQEKIMRLVRKYAMRWLLKTRATINKIIDPMHLSIFDVSNSLGNAVDYLHQETGVYKRKMNMFVLDLISSQLIHDKLIDSNEEEDSEKKENVVIEEVVLNSEIEKPIDEVEANNKEEQVHDEEYETHEEEEIEDTSDEDELDGEESNTELGESPDDNDVD